MDLHDVYQVWACTTHKIQLFYDICVLGDKEARLSIFCICTYMLEHLDMDVEDL